ncbi:MAG: 4a-hydroxytetrahydrobiopterin dehydratase, partial [Brachybacterium sp.]|nr:4a-hydroxytetrahydrobiopterin dehydratase [Brachybacterium sp.]
MDMLFSDEIAASNLTDWRKLAQGLHARYLLDDFQSGIEFLAAVGRAGRDTGHYPSATVAAGHVDLTLMSENAIYREQDGTEHVVQWVTQKDIDLARLITEIAEAQGLVPDPRSVAMFEMGVDATDSAAIAPFWAALLTGDPSSQGRGTPGDEIRDATGRVPHLWFGDLDDRSSRGGRVPVEGDVGGAVVEERVARALAAGGTVV